MIIIKVIVTIITTTIIPIMKIIMIQKVITVILPKVINGNRGKSYDIAVHNIKSAAIHATLSTKITPLNVRINSKD